MSLEQLRRQVRNYRTLMLQVYDQLGGHYDRISSGMAHFHDNRRARENPVRLDHVFIDTNAYAWKSPVPTAEEWEKVEWTIPLDGYAASFEYDEIDIDRPGVLRSVGDIMRRLPGALIEKRVDLMWRVFQRNPLAYDGNDFFSTAHEHPNGRGLYSNATNNASEIEPSTVSDEALHDFVRSMRKSLLDQTSFKKTLTWRDAGEQSFVLIAPNSLMEGLERIRDEERIRQASGNAEMNNTIRGQFGLVESPQEMDYVYGYWQGPSMARGNVRSLVWTLDRDPREFVEPPSATTRGKVKIGMKSIFAVKALFPQAAHRRRFRNLGG